MLFGEARGRKDKDSAEDGYSSVVLIFIPTILQSLDFTLLYLQLDDMQKGARIQGGIAYMKKEAYLKFQKIIHIITFTYIGIFIAV